MRGRLRALAWLVILLTCLGALGIAIYKSLLRDNVATEHKTLPGTFVGKPAAAILDEFGVTDEELQRWDEPPAELSFVTFKRPWRAEPRVFCVQLRYKPELVSPDRTWSIDLIRGTAVVRIWLEDGKGGFYEFE